MADEYERHQVEGNTSKRLALHFRYNKGEFSKLNGPGFKGGFIVQNKYVNSVSKHSSFPSYIFIIDSGCSRNFVWSKHLFVNYRRTESEHV